MADSRMIDGQREGMRAWEKGRGWGAGGRGDGTVEQQSSDSITASRDTMEEFEEPWLTNRFPQNTVVLPEGSEGVLRLGVVWSFRFYHNLANRLGT